MTVRRICKNARIYVFGSFANAMNEGVIQEWQANVAERANGKRIVTPTCNS